MKLSEKEAQQHSETNVLWHSNTSNIVYEKELLPLTRNSEPVFQLTTCNEKVHAVFASGGKYAEKYAYAYALKIPDDLTEEQHQIKTQIKIISAIPRDSRTEEDEKLLNKLQDEWKNIPSPRGEAHATIDIWGTIFMVFDGQKLFEERIRSFTSHIYKLDPKGFRNTSGTEYICEEPAKIIERIDIPGTEVLETTMKQGVQVLFFRDELAIKTFYNARNEHSKLGDRESYYKAEHNLIYSMIEKGEFIHLNQEKDINTIGKNSCKLGQNTSEKKILLDY